MHHATHRGRSLLLQEIEDPLLHIVKDLLPIDLVKDLVRKTVVDLQLLARYRDPPEKPPRPLWRTEMIIAGMHEKGGQMDPRGERHDEIEVAHDLHPRLQRHMPHHKRIRFVPFHDLRVVREVRWIHLLPEA